MSVPPPQQAEMVDNVLAEMEAAEQQASVPPPPPQQQQPRQYVQPPSPPQYDMQPSESGTFLGVSSGYMKYVCVASILSAVLAFPQVSSIFRVLPGVSYAPTFGVPIIVGLVIATLLWMVEYFEIL